MPDETRSLPHDPALTDSVTGSAASTGGTHPPDAGPRVLGTISRYVFGSEIARGGMGAIYRAADTVLNREVAIKVLQEQFPIESSASRRFMDEAHITAQLQHPGIPPVQDLGTLPDGRPFLAMKLIQGQTLADILASRAASAAGSNDDASKGDTRSLTRRGSPDLLPVFESICQAVGFAHSVGIIHRDLKPANVMVGAFGEVQVMDWGLAKSLASRAASAAGSNDDASKGDTRSLTRHGSPDADPDRTTDHRPAEDSTDERTRSGQAVGTPAYMPPEQARGETRRVDYRSDVFGLGAILCVLLTGRPPFHARRSAEALEKARRADLADAFTHLDACGADAELIALCKRCLSAEPAERPENGGAVAALVAQYRASVEERLRTAERNRAAAEAKAIEQRKKRRVQLALAGAVLVIAAGGAAFGWWQERQASAQARVEGERAAAVKQARERVPELIAIAAGLRRTYQFEEADSTLRQAAELATTAGLDDLQPAVAQAQSDLKFVVELDAIRMKRSTWIAEVGGKGRFDEAGAPAAYRAAFLERGLDVLATPERVGEYVAGSVVRTELLVALDDWAVLKKDEPAVRDAVLATARRGEPDPALNAYRDPALWTNPERLRSLARSAEVNRLSPVLLVALSDVMAEQGVDPAPMLRHALSRYPREFLIAFSLGQVLCSLNDTDPEAVGAYRAARALRPKSIPVLINLGGALQASRDLPGAIAAFKEAIRLDPNNVAAHNNLGNVLRASGDRSGAISACKKAVRLDPELDLAHINLGIALADSGDLLGAIAAFKEAIRLNPKSAAAYNNLGVALQASRDLPGAIDAYKEATRLDPKYAPAHYNLGVALAASDNLPGAIAAFKGAIRLNPKDVRHHYNLGLALYLSGDLPDAIAAFKEAIRLDPKYAPAHYYLGTALKAKGDLPDAIAALKEAIRLDPTMGAALKDLGDTLYESGDFPGAIAAFKELIRLDPNNGAAHYDLGVALQDSGNRSGAIAAYKEAIRRDPNHALAHSNLGIALAMSDDLDGAIASFEEALRLQPNNPGFQKNLALARKLKAERDAKAAAPLPMRLDVPSSWDAVPVSPPVVAPAPRPVK